MSRSLAAGHVTPYQLNFLKILPYQPKKQLRSSSRNLFVKHKGKKDASRILNATDVKHWDEIVAENLKRNTLGFFKTIFETHPFHTG